MTVSDYQDTVLFGDALEQLQTIPDETVQMCVTSPPYWGLRDYGVDGQLGLEETPEEYVDNLTRVFREVRRVLSDDGTLWLNIGDSYAGNKTTGRNDADRKWKGNDKKTQVSTWGKPKDLCMIPARVAMALQQDGWYLRSDIIWHKPNPMPESVKDRPTKAHEYVFLLSKSEKYYYDWEAIAEELSESTHKRYKYGWKGEEDRGYPNGRQNNMSSFMDPDNEKANKKNKRSVWSVNTKPFPEAHFAVFPPKLIAPCIKAGSKPYDIVVDPFFGSGTTGEVCKKLNRYYLGIELNEEYKPIQDKRLSQSTLEFEPI